jgi:small subunit ribosomal protein S2
MILNNKNKIEEMFQAGVHYGYNKSRRHPSTSSYIYATKNGVDIIDIEKTHELFEKACEIISEYAKSDKTILFVGTKAEAKKYIDDVAMSLNLPYVNERWVGGILTNFSEIKKRIQKLVDLREEKEKGHFDKYTKKEKLLIEREMDSMSKNFQGLIGMNKAPDLIFVIDSKKENIAVTEARKMNIPVMALANTDCNINHINYPIVGNDASTTSIKFFIETIKKVYSNISIEKENTGIKTKPQ